MNLLPPLQLRGRLLGETTGSPLARPCALDTRNRCNPQSKQTRCTWTADRADYANKECHDRCCWLSARPCALSKSASSVVRRRVPANQVAEQVLSGPSTIPKSHAMLLVAVSQPPWPAFLMEWGFQPLAGSGSLLRNAGGVTGPRCVPSSISSSDATGMQIRELFLAARSIASCTSAADVDCLRSHPNRGPNYSAWRLNRLEFGHVRIANQVYLWIVQTIADQLSVAASLNQVVVPDLWQQQAVSGLRAGQDVVVHAPTGAGKTLVFELWSNQGRNRGQAIYTVPTRALANDKLAEWRARGWNVGIATGDLSENLDAPVLVATLETQKNRLIRGEGPSLLVVDEYQMIADPDRGLNYELAMALAPSYTQLLLLSGSVENPQDTVRWLRRIGRQAILIRHEERPVPLEEVYLNQINYHVPSEIRGYWPRAVAKALAEGLGPLLIFAPRRQAAETLAAELARNLPCPDALQLSPAQKQVVGEHLARMLRSRVAYHHSGLSYGARAGVVEPLAKAGQLRVVVATMGLAAGINFSLRSVALAGDSYRRDEVELPLRPDEILQMFGRAGRRGIDETGYVLVTDNEIRLLDAHPAHLTRNGMVDWGALLGLMRSAAEDGESPFLAAVRAQERLFTTKPICLGVEESLKNPTVPCRLGTDAERSRHVRKRHREMLNSRGEWEPSPAMQEVHLANICVPRYQLSSSLVLPPADDAVSSQQEEREAAYRSANALADSHRWTHSTTAAQPNSTTPSGPAQPPTLRPVLSEPAALEKVGTGMLIVLEEKDGYRVHGRALTVAERLQDDRLIIAKWVRRLTNWNGRQVAYAVWQQRLVPLLEQRLAAQHTPVVRLLESARKITAQVSLAELTLKVPVDRYGAALWHPLEREVLPPDCAGCNLIDVCRNLSAAAGTAAVWRRLGLIDTAGVPTRRGAVVSYFSQSDGLAIAAALEDTDYPIDEMVYDFANLDAGFRFAGEENRWGGRLAIACHKAYGLQTVPGYLENGLPPKYGAGAEQVVAAVHRDPASKHEWSGTLVGPGDIDRAIIEWRSLLRQITHAPPMDWPRWSELQNLARTILNETESPTLTALPPLEYHQTRRIEHRLVLRRH